MGLAALAVVRADHFRDEAKVHDARIALKQLRYGAEALPAAVCAIAPAELKRLKKCVAALGRIHDIDVHAQRIAKLEKRGRLSPPASAAYRVELARSRKRLVSTCTRLTRAQDSPDRSTGRIRSSTTQPSRTFEIRGMRTFEARGHRRFWRLLSSSLAPSLAREEIGWTRTQERFEFEIRDLKVTHQGGNALTLKLRYDYRRGLKPADYPDFRRIAQACEEFFTSYPNDADFWEVLNLKLTARLLREFPALESVTLEIHVAPTDRIPFPRTSIVTRSR